MHIVRYQIVNVSGTDQRAYSILGGFMEKQKNLQISQKAFVVQCMTRDIFAFSFHDYDIHIGIDPIS